MELLGFLSTEITIASLDIDIVAFSRIPFNLNMEYTYRHLMLVIYTKITAKVFPLRYIPPPLRKGPG